MRVLLRVLLALVALVGSTTTTGAASVHAYDAPAVARVDTHRVEPLLTPSPHFTGSREWSASLYAEARGASTTRLPRGVATNTADDAARFVVDSAGNTTLRAQGSNGWLNVSSHAAERMTQRGISIEAVESTLGQSPFQYWQTGANAGWRTGFYDPASRVFVTTSNGEVVTVINNASQTYINNVMARVPPP